MFSNFLAASLSLDTSAGTEPGTTTKSFSPRDEGQIVGLVGSRLVHLAVEERTLG